MLKEAVYEKIGSKIRDVRKDRGLNQADIATALDMTRTTITHIETGRQTLQVHQLILIADALDVPIMELLELDLDALRRTSSAASAEELPDNLANVLQRLQNKKKR